METIIKTANIPRTLQDTGRYCVWRLETGDGGKTKKRPYDLKTGYPANTAREENFGSLHDAEKAYETGCYDGIGIGIFSPVCGIDIDHCIGDNGDLSPVAKDIVNTMDAYTEISPSGHGLHLYFRADGFDFNRQKYLINNRDLGVEVYIAGQTVRYLTLTGNTFVAGEFEDRCTQLKTILDRYMRRSEHGTPSLKPPGNTVLSKALSDAEIEKLLDLAYRSKSGDDIRDLMAGNLGDRPSASNADLALCAHLAYWTGRNPELIDRIFRRSGLMRPKWDEKHGNDTYGNITIKKACDTCTSVYTAQGANPKKKEEQDGFLPYNPIAADVDIPDYPVNCLPTVLGEFVKAVSANSQTDPCMAATTVLGTLSSCVQGKFMVVYGSYAEKINLYTLVIADSGARKSSVQKQVSRVITQYETAFNAEHDMDFRQNRQERELLEIKIAGIRKKLEKKFENSDVDELKKLTAQLDALPTIYPRRSIVDDISSEALGVLLDQNHGCLTSLTAEGGAFDILAGRYSKKANIDIWTKCYTGDDIYVDRIGREQQRISNPSMTAIWAVQPSVLNEMFANPTMVGRGLTARFLYAFPAQKEKSFITPVIPADVEKAYTRLMTTLLSIPYPDADKQSTIRLSDAAQNVAEECFEEHERYKKEAGRYYPDWCERYIGMVMRIAALLHCAKHNQDPLKEDISEDTMQAAITIGRYYRATAHKAYTGCGSRVVTVPELKVFDKLLQMEDNVKKHDLFRACRNAHIQRADDLTPYLDTLVSHGYIKVTQPPSTGRGRPQDMMITVNPDAIPADI